MQTMTKFRAAVSVLVGAAFVVLTVTQDQTNAYSGGPIR